MDIISHAIAGACTGSYFGKPIEGAVISVLPDLVLGFKRKKQPNDKYRITHSLLNTILFSLVVTDHYLWLWCLTSHLILDLFTHGSVWSPRLFFPLNNYHMTGFTEWEFGNRSWLCGLILTLVWCITWLLLPELLIGFQ